MAWDDEVLDSFQFPDINSKYSIPRLSLGLTAGHDLCLCCDVGSWNRCHSDFVVGFEIVSVVVDVDLEMSVDPDRLDGGGDGLCPEIGPCLFVGFDLSIESEIWRAYASM